MLNTTLQTRNAAEVGTYGRKKKNKKDHVV